MSPRLQKLSANDERLLNLVESAVLAMRKAPEMFPSDEAFAASTRLSPARFSKLCVEHFHSYPATLLRKARLEAAAARLRAGAEAKLPSPSGFCESYGLSPEEYGGLEAASNYHLTLPKNYPLAALHRALNRDPESANEQLHDGVYTLAMPFADGPIVTTLRFPKGIHQRVEVALSRRTSEIYRVHAMICGILGLGQETRAWVELAQQRGAGELVAHCPEFRIHQTPSVYDGLLWTVIGQQINLPFAFRLRRRLIVLAGTPMGDTLYAPPTPDRVAALEPGDLLPLQFSRQKADYVTSISRLIAEGRLDLEALRLLSATRAERTLLAVRGLGKWSANFLLMRALGFPDCLPIGDTGVTSGLWSYFHTKTRPDAETTQRLMRPFSPYRSFATVHLWQWKRPRSDRSQRSNNAIP